MDFCGLQENKPDQITQILATNGKADGKRLVNLGDYDSRTPLHVAAAEGNQSCVLKLLDEDANPNPEDRWGHTPLYDACNHTHTPCVVVLIRFGAELRMNEVDLASHLCMETSLNRRSAVYTWLVAECNPNAADYDGRTALHAACTCGSLSTAMHLLEFSADPNAQDRWGNTPLSDASMYNHSRLVELLESHSVEQPGLPPGPELL